MLAPLKLLQLTIETGEQWLHSLSGAECVMLGASFVVASWLWYHDLRERVVKD